MQQTKALSSSSVVIMKTMTCTRHTGTQVRTTYKVGRNEPGLETAKRMVGTIGPGMTQELKQ